MFSHEIIEAGNDDPTEIFFNFLGGIDTLRADEAVDEKNGLEDAEVENAEGPEPDETQFRIPEGHGITGSPFQIGENLHIGDIDLRPQRAGHTPGEAEHLGQDGDIGGLQGMSARTESIIGPAVIEKNSGLAFPDCQLSAELDFTGTFFGDSVNQFFPGFIKPFYNFQKDNIVRSHDFRPLIISCPKLVF